MLRQSGFLPNDTVDLSSTHRYGVVEVLHKDMAEQSSARGDGRAEFGPRIWHSRVLPSDTAEQGSALQCGWTESGLWNVGPTI